MSALGALVDEKELYHCPICCSTAASHVVDVALTVFLSEHPEAVSCAVRLIAQGRWEYTRPRHSDRGLSNPAKRRRRTVAAGFARGEGGVQTKAPAQFARTEVRARAPAAQNAAPGKPGSGPPNAEKLAVRRQRREHAARSKALEATRAALIRRSLMEDTSTGEALWSISER